LGENFRALALIGTIMLSTFIYSVVLLIIISFNKETFILEKLAEE